MENKKSRKTKVNFFSSNNYYTKEQVDKIDLLSSKLKYSKMKVKRESVDYFFRLIEAGYKYKPVLEESDNAMQLKQGMFSIKQINACKVFGDSVFTPDGKPVTEGQIRRDALDLYYANIVEGSLRPYSTEQEIFNVSDEEPAFYATLDEERIYKNKKP